MASIYHYSFILICKNVHSFLCSLICREIYPISLMFLYNSFIHSSIYPFIHSFTYSLNSIHSIFRVFNYSFNHSKYYNILCSSRSLTNRRRKRSFQKKTNTNKRYHLLTDTRRKLNTLECFRIMMQGERGYLEHRYCSFYIVTEEL